MYVLHAHYTPFRKIEESKGKSFVFLTPFCLVWCLCVCVCVCVCVSLSLSLFLSLSLSLLAINCVTPSNESPAP